MANQQRIFYACQAVAITAQGAATVTTADIVRGAQSVGMSSTFTLDQVFELGQIEIYENVEEVADIEVTIEKVIDGEKLIFDLASGGACKTDLVAASKVRSDVYVAIYDDGQSQATGTPRNVCYNSGMYVSSVAYNYSVDGSATESVTLVGNDRFWNDTTAGVIGTSAESAFGSVLTEFGTDTAVSGVVRRADVDIVNSDIPTEALYQRDSSDASTGQSDGARIQSISVSADFGQENIQELGRFGPYTRYATFPLEVSCDIEVMALQGDLVSVSGNAPNLTNRTINIVDSAGTVLALGDNNKLSSVSYTGGDTGGGNATVTYSYTNFNSLTVNGGS
jgi:hypothetical protein